MSDCLDWGSWSTVISQQTQNICITFVQRRSNVFGAGPSLYKCYTNVLCLLGCGSSKLWLPRETLTHVDSQSARGIEDQKVLLIWIIINVCLLFLLQGGGPRVVVSTAAFHARVRGSVPGLGGLKETKMFLPHPRVKVSIAGSLRDREVASSASDRQGSNFESCVWRTVSSQSSHHPQDVLLAQFSLYVHKGGLKPDSFLSASFD